VSIVEYAKRTTTMSPTYKDDLTPLIERCRRHERTAQNQLHKVLYRYVFAVCYRYIGAIDETKEVVQDVFFKAFTKLNHYEGHLSFRTWVKKIAVNTCIDRHRAKVRDLPTTDLEEGFFVQETAQPLEDLEAEYLLEFIAQLPTAYRTTFNLYAVDGYSYSEIADLLGVMKGTVSSNISKARVHLQKMIEEYDLKNRA
jgi:RNA polymerase sigma factor (sigma-70 family)